jgi:hypothetical protein
MSAARPAPRSLLLLLPPSGSVSSAIPDFNCGDNRARWEFKEFECGHGFYRKIERLEHRGEMMVSALCGHTRIDCIDFFSEIGRADSRADRATKLLVSTFQTRGHEHREGLQPPSKKTTSASQAKIVLDLFQSVRQIAATHFGEFLDGPCSTWLHSTHSS